MKEEYTKKLLLLKKLLSGNTFENEDEVETFLNTFALYPSFGDCYWELRGGLDDVCDFDTDVIEADEELSALYYDLDRCAMNIPSREDVFEDFEVVDEYGGEGMGQMWYEVVLYKPLNLYYRIDASYYSYCGAELNGETWRKVEPKQKTITVYE